MRRQPHVETDTCTSAGTAFAAGWRRNRRRRRHAAAGAGLVPSGARGQRWVVRGGGEGGEGGRHSPGLGAVAPDGASEEVARRQRHAPRPKPWPKPSPGLGAVAPDGAGEEVARRQRHAPRPKPWPKPSPGLGAVAPDGAGEEVARRQVRQQRRPRVAGVLRGRDLRGGGARQARLHGAVSGPAASAPTPGAVDASAPRDPGLAEEQDSLFRASLTRPPVVCLADWAPPERTAESGGCWCGGSGGGVASDSAPCAMQTSAKHAARPPKQPTFSP